MIKKYSKIGFITLLILSSIFLVSNCRNKASEVENNVGTREIKDDLNKEIKLPDEVTTAVSLAPNLTEIIFAVGAGDKLVGVTSFCNYPEGVTKIKKVGDTLKPNVETIIALKPQVVFVSTASQLEAFSSTLEAQGISVFVTNPHSIDGVYKSIRTIGEVFGEKEKSIEVVDSLKKRVADVEAKTKGIDRVRTFVQIDKSLYTIGSSSFLTDVVFKAGGISVTTNIQMAYPKITKEAAFALKPDAIILSDSEDNDEPNEVFKDSNAVKNDRVYKVDADILSRPSPRFVDAIEMIAKDLHPDIFE